MTNAALNDASSPPERAAALLVYNPPVPIVFGLLALIAIVALFVYSYTARAAADRDQFIYAQVGKEILAGKRLYRETWIDKPPIGLLIYALPQLFVPRSYRAIVVFDALLIVGQALLIAWAFRKVSAAAIAVALFTILYPLENGVCLWPSTEHFANVFLTGILLLTLDITRNRSFRWWQCLAAGALVLAVFHVRQNMVLSGALPLLAIVTATRSIRDRLQAVLLMVSGALAMWGLVFAVVMVVGDLRGYVFSVFEYPRRFASAGSIAETAGLVRYFLGSSLALFTLVFGGLAITGRYRLLSIAAIAVGIGSCLTPMHNHPHYLANAIPYVALLIGLGTERFLEFGPALPWLSVAAVTVCFLPTTFGRLQVTSQYPTHDALLRIAGEADRVAPTDATLLVVGPITSEAIQFASRLPAAHKHCWSFQFQSPWKEMLPTAWESICEDYLAQPPGVIVIEEGSLRDATAERPPAEMIESLTLVRRLLAAGDYEQARTTDKYVILLRKQ